MRRVEANVRTVTLRLQQMNYVFQGHGDQRAGSGAGQDSSRIQGLSPQVQDLVKQIQQARKECQESETPAP